MLSFPILYKDDDVPTFWLLLQTFATSALNLPIHSIGLRFGGVLFPIQSQRLTPQVRDKQVRVQDSGLSRCKPPTFLFETRVTCFAYSIVNPKTLFISSMPLHYWFWVLAFVSQSGRVCRVQVSTQRKHE